MREMKGRNGSNGESNLRSVIIAVGERLDSHSDKVCTMLKGFELKQVNDTKFSLNQSFSLTENSLTEASLNGMLRDYESLRHDVRNITDFSFDSIVDFEKLFPRLDINFESYYCVAVSLLNMYYQLQLMKLYCFRILGP
jgi:hypothetical protein